jgi:hypothetical protein
MQQESRLHEFCSETLVEIFNTVRVIEQVMLGKNRVLYEFYAGHRPLLEIYSV